MAWTIGVVNHSSYTYDVDGFMVACGRYAADIAQAWGTPAWDVTRDLVSGEFSLAIVDTLDQADALGYHDVGPDGKPYALVGAKASVDNGVSLETVLSHELAEFIGDPLCSQWVQDAKTGLFYAQEFADATEGDTFAVNGRPMSNWLKPSYFNPFGKPPYDAMGVVSAPFTIRPNGYAIVMDQQGSVTQQFGDEVPAWKRQAKATRHKLERAYKRGVR